MDIIKEIEKISKQNDIILKFIGEKMFDISSLQAELDRAKNLVTKSVSAIKGLKSTIQTHEATIAQQAATIATHTATIVETAVSSNAVSTVTSSLHDVLSELESFLTSEVSANNAAAVPIQETVNVNSVVANNISASVTEEEVLADIHQAYQAIVATANSVPTINVDSIPIESVEELDQIYNRLQGSMQHNSQSFVDPRMGVLNPFENATTHIKLGL